MPDVPGDKLLRRHMSMAAHRLRKCHPDEKAEQARRYFDSVRLFLGRPRGGRVGDGERPG